MRHTLKRGCVQVYTGDGKGKTTAAIGLAVRAAGAGLRVFIGQFIKGRACSEAEALQRLDDMIAFRQFGRGQFIYDKPTPEDIRMARSGLDEVERVLTEGTCSVVILDEANVAVSVGLFPVERLLDLVEAKPDSVELVFTGRNASPRLIARADLVTDMHEVKHYFAAGVPARQGIDC